MLTEPQIRRYSRHVLLPDIGGRGQRALLAARVGVEVGPGRDAECCGLVFLAAAGVGTLMLTGDIDAAVTADEVEGGIAYGAFDIGRPRLEALRQRLFAINSDVVVTTGAPHRLTLDCAAASRWAGTDHRSTVPGDRVAEALMVGGRAAAKLIAHIARRPIATMPSGGGQP